MTQVPLLCSKRIGWAAVRDLCGSDEEAVRGVGTAAAASLIDRVLVDMHGATNLAGLELSAPDRDRVLAEVYREAFGDEVVADTPCVKCGERFELQLALSAVGADLASRTTAPNADGWYTVDANLAFRLPTGEDELAVAALPDEDAERALQNRCSRGSADLLKLSEAMESVAPLLDVELETACPSCGHVDLLAFDIQTYLLQAILAESAQRASDIHRLAATYGWTLSEILGLSRQRRRAFADLIEREVR
jgi:hypothetical protein